VTWRRPKLHDEDGVPERLCAVAQPYNKERMTRRVQIVVSSRPSVGPQDIVPRQGFWQRFKLLITGLTIAVVTVALLIVDVVLGSILAAVILVVIAVAILFAVLRMSLKRAHHDNNRA
jgi:Flp pilus assembly protein TadB